MSFTEEDVVKLREFSQFVTQNARFELDIPEMLQFVGLMQRYQKITDRVEAHVAELKRIIPAGKSATDPVVSPASKKTATRKKKV